MERNSEISTRKKDHININLQKDVNSSNTTGTEKFRLIHNALPDLDFQKIDPSVTLFQKKLSFPLQISSMTGGTKNASELNRIFAETAEKHQIALGVGSQRIGIEDPQKMDTFRVRKYAPTTLLFSNLGAVQLNYGIGVDECRKAVEEIGADALILHLNPLQEVLMENGDTNFSGLIEKIGAVASKLSVPIILKEVGWGISWKVAKELIDAGVSAIDVAGAGGTSWSEVEMHRASDSIRKAVASGFRNWGISTIDALLEIRNHDQEALVFASGGLRNGIDIVKCIALGADLCGIARPFLQKAVESKTALDEFILILKQQVKVTMFAIGAQKIQEIGPESIRSK